ncbi:DUF654-domain-containing protein [Aaosphaeria arxii CBS 175.79]|uniref:DUF654-domain-containing protein n=1 Tax=Aaosphaeria arxii CBS 175.79 TaxID=1450172 RepID=A0A6A5Y8B0_9PLEO|nr:DUF654-domain-containing protein [Aaosphaeria arxii CBS 175.79]KAF2021473.1 DUF654-domain-containing protein [Aaosphaeria arxii CBS 175.79]
MSSRALRRAQKELEEKQQLELLRKEEEEEEDESEEDAPPPSQAKASLFAMLGDANEDEEDDEDNDQSETNSRAGDSEDVKPVAAVAKSSKKSKKKKKKGKGKAKEKESHKAHASSASIDGMDEIDRALLALKLSTQNSGKEGDFASSTISEEMQQLYSTLAVDTQYLNASNEMRKLFGRAAVQTNDDDQAARQRGRGQQHGIAAATAAAAGRNTGGRNLASLGLRRNIFIQGKEEWPRATSGGLAMEVVERRNDGSVEYRFVHNTTYQSVQKEFESCVASMDPDRMVRHLHFNPYHISTLLQVSEIAKQQRDNATAGDLLERALFSMGRAVHSTFSTNLSQGKARLDFRRPENREFWLAGWRYISTLGVRATWRTAFEWSKLLLSLSPEDDPYCLRLVVDQLALRGRDLQALVDLVDSDHLQREWKIPPNLAFSVALAHDGLQNPQKARSSLRLAIKEYPWIASRLCRELEINPIPKTIWGKEPNNDYQELLCQLYVPKVKDLWNTTAATSLLVEVAYSFEEPLDAGANPYWLSQIDETNLARHVILSDDRDLLSLLDVRFKHKYTSVSDPLPPDDNITSYNLTADRQRNQAQLLTEMEQLRDYFQRVDLGSRIDLTNENNTQEDFLRALEQAGTTIQEFRRNTARVQTVRDRLQEVGVQVVFQGQEEDRPVDTSESEAD